MIRSAAIGTAILACCLATGAAADCPGAGDGTGTVHPLNAANKGDVDLILSMSMMPRLMKLDYKSASSLDSVPCDVARFSTGGTDYHLHASPIGAGTARVATAGGKDAPVARLIPVTNVLEAIAAAKTGKAASVSGYMLATFGRHDITGWRLYTAVPDQATLVADMTAALGQTMKPVFRTDLASGKTNIFLPA